MSKETEKVFRELHKYMDQFGGELTKEEAEEKVQEFIQMYNQKIKSNTEVKKDQWYYLDLAMEAEDDKVARRNAQKALTIDPYCTDAEMFLIELMDITIEEAKKRYEKLIKKTESHLKEEGFFDEENIGIFYGLVETRPYLRALSTYMDILIGMGKCKMAVSVAEKILHLNENDNMGVRYVLMALYAFFEDVDAAEKLLKEYEADEGSTSMLLPLILLYYKMDDYSKARRYLKKLNKCNPDFRRFLKMEISEDEIDEKMSEAAYSPNTVGEILVVMENDQFLIDSTGAGILWMQAELDKL